MNPFDYVKSILETKNNLIVNEATEKAYVPFLTNRALSYYIDTVMHAQEMNMASHLDNCLQYRYYINTVRPMKRKYAKWAKKSESNDIDIVQEFFGYNYQKAKTALSILSKEQLKEIKKRLEKGGVK